MKSVAYFLGLSAGFGLTLQIGMNSQLRRSLGSAILTIRHVLESRANNHVTLIDNLGNVLSENSDNDSLSGLTSTQLAARRKASDRDMP